MDSAADIQRIFGEFSRLTGQGMSLDEALRRSCDGADRATAEKFSRDCRATIAGEVKKLSAMIRTAGGNLREAVDRQSLPRYIREAVLQDLGLPIEESRATGDPLTAYIEKGIALIPEKDKRPLIAYSQHPEQLITDLKRLDAWKQRGVTEYGFIPSKHRLLVLDLDRGDGHANKADGIANFKQTVQGQKLTKKLQTFFSSFPVNFPCYTETPSGGLHLYFKADYITQEIARLFDNAALNARNIELKYNTKATAAGTVRNGRAYVMHGSLEAAPVATLDLLDLLTKTQPKPQKKPYKPFARPDYRKWNDTPEGIIDKATELYSGYSSHDFVYKTAVLFHNAGMDKATAERYIMQTPQHLQRTDQSDTQTAINSIYR